jgi:phosphopantetheinyl transferase (holo-ACP synthase)
VLEDKWSAYVVNVLPFYEDKGMTKTEADKLAELCIKSEFAKTNLLKDFIEIKAFSPYTYDEANPTYNFSKVTNAQTVEFRVNLTGILGAFSSDKSIFLAETERSETIEFQLKYTNGTWNVVGSTSNYSSMFSSSDKSLLYKEIPTKRFGTYSEKGFDAIYMKRVEEALPTNNPLATLMTFSKEFSDFFSANSATLTNENLAKFFALNDEDKAESAKEALQKVIALPTLSETQGYTNFTLTSIKFRDFDEEIEDEKLRQKGDVLLTFTAKEVLKKGKKFVETGVTKEFYLSLDCIMTPEGWKIVWF